jgi:hypothetical protein
MFSGVHISDILDTSKTLSLEEIEIKQDEEEIIVEKLGYCIECEDQPAYYHCIECKDDFCQVCCSSQHRKGSRKKHLFKLLHPESKQVDKMDLGSTELNNQDTITHSLQDLHKSLDLEETELQSSGTVGTLFLERAKYIPLRLTLEERKFLRLLEAALTVSEYTDKIDVIVYSNKAKRIVAQIRELCSIISGLVMASDYNAGQKLFQDRSFEDNQDFFSFIFELYFFYMINFNIEDEGIKL